MRHRAFTLLELMIVIAIIGVLASLLLAVIGQVRGLAETRTCQSNLRQMQFASLTYAQENRGRFVGLYFRNADDQKFNVWRSNRIFLDYLTNGQVADGNGDNVLRKFLCPTVRKVKKSAPNSGITWLELSYAYNTQNPRRRIGNVGPTTRDLAVGERITFIDGLDWEVTNFWILGTDYFTNPAVREGTFAQNTIAFRHRKRADYALGDGSVSSKAYDFLRDWDAKPANNMTFIWNPQKETM